MFKEFLRPVRLCSPSGRTEIVQARFVDAICVYNAIYPATRPVQKLEKPEADALMLFAASPVIRLLRDCGVVGKTDLFSVLDKPSGEIIGLTSITRPTPDTPHVQLVCHIGPQARDFGHEEAASILALTRAQQVFNSRYVLGRSRGEIGTVKRRLQQFSC